MDGRMSRGRWIRRLDEVSVDVHARRSNGPLTPAERHLLSQTLERLWPLVANTRTTSRKPTRQPMLLPKRSTSAGI
jgi:hypothetical protein